MVGELVELVVIMHWTVPRYTGWDACHTVKIVMKTPLFCVPLGSIPSHKTSAHTVHLNEAATLQCVHRLKISE